MYLGAPRLLGLAPTEVCMVAAHIGDLREAQKYGLKAVYVKRPTEDRDEQDTVRAGAGGDVDAVVVSFEELSALF
jgi:FMN phosphatase YigB (HAD superfamily)